MAQQIVRFQSASGSELAGILDTPGGDPRGYALFAHCFTCSKNLKAVNNISKSLNDAGIAVLRFDFTGLGESEGEFADTNFSSNVSDLHAACEYLGEHYAAPNLLIGHSLGGAAVLCAAKTIASATAVVTIAAPFQPGHVTEMLDESRSEIETKGEATVNLGGRPFQVKKQFLEDIEGYQLADTVGELRKALLVMHAPLDSVVEIDNASEIFLHAKHPKSFVSLDDADHLLSRNEDSQYAGSVIAAWASRYMPVAKPAELLAAAGADTTARTHSSGFRTAIVSAGHRLVADEPESYGGTDEGPTPYGLLSAALASCTTMTLRMYAARKKISLDSATVRISHAKIHAKDCGDCESTSGKIDEFEKELVLEGDLSEEQRQRMLEIADMCPVHRTLHGEIKIRTKLAE